MKSGPRPRFDEIDPKPPGYVAARPLAGGRTALFRTDHLHERADRVCASSSWRFANRPAEHCRIAFEIVDDPRFGAVAFYAPDVHWIVFHAGTLDAIGTLVNEIYARGEYLAAVGIHQAPPASLRAMREVTVRLALEFLFRHEWMHVLLGHTGSNRGEGLGAVADAAALDARPPDTPPAAHAQPQAWFSEPTIVREYSADYFAAVSIADGCAARRFVFLEEDELPPASDAVSLVYLAFTGAACVLLYFSLMGLTGGGVYPMLSTRLTTLVHGFIERDPDPRADSRLGRMLTAVLRDLAAGIRATRIDRREKMLGLLAAMDSDAATDTAMAEIKKIQQVWEPHLRNWSAHCVEGYSPVREGGPTAAP